MNDLVFIQNEQAITTSLKVAEYFGKRHNDVLRAIENAISTVRNFAQSEEAFEKSSYIDSTGKSNPMYYLNRDAFSFVVMGFTGERAAEFKWKYIQAFNQMEKKLIELLAERKSAEWLEIRRAGILSNNKLKSTIQQNLIPLAREQGSTTDDRFFYINYQRAVNKAAGVSPKCRDALSISQLYEVDKLQDIATCSIKGLASKNEPYKKIYSDTKQTLENYAQISLISQRFLN